MHFFFNFFYFYLFIYFLFFPLDIFPRSESIENLSRQSEREQNKLQWKFFNSSIKPEQY